jgi:hypothetical protein
VFEHERNCIPILARASRDICCSFSFKCVFDDSILAGPDQKEINKVIKDLKKAKLDITVEGDIQDFLGVNIEKHKNGTIQLTQPHLIDAVLDDLRMKNDQVVPKTIPAKSSEILGRHDDSEPFDNSFNYRSVIGKLNYQCQTRDEK